MSWSLVNLVIFFAVHCCLGYQNKYRVKQERCDVEFANKTICEFRCNTYHLNRTQKAINLTMMYKNPTEDMKVLVSTYMWMTNLYKLIAIQFEMKFVSILSYTMFDLDNLFHNYSTPPLGRFVLPNVRYIFKGWLPNGKKFPPGGQSGKYKIHLTLCSANKDINFAIGNWYFSIEDIIRY